MAEHRGERRGQRRVTVAEAAEILGISKDAVRMRIKRDTLVWDKNQGRVFVWLDDDANGEHNADHTQPGIEGSELVADLQDQVRYLREQLDAEREARTEERRRHDTLMAQLMQRIPELEAPQEQPGAPETVEEEPEAAQPRPGTPGAQEAPRKPWWRRVFGR